MPLTIQYGADRFQISVDTGGGVLRVPCASLGEVASEVLLGEKLIPRHIEADEALWEFSQGAIIALGTTVADFREDTAALYARLFSLCEKRSLARVWHHVPRINEDTDGLENYRAFCVGRAQAFARFVGEDPAHIPAASAVGCRGNELCLWALAFTRPVQPVENPLQVPAYHYPEKYSPLPPFFARGSVVLDKPTHCFISGTAAIRGTDSLYPESLENQVGITAENMQAVADRLMAKTGKLDWSTVQNVKIYLRHPGQATLACEGLRQHLPEVPAGRIILLEADICRRELLVEIEARWLLS